MTSIFCFKCLRNLLLASAGLLCGLPAFASTTVIGTSNYAYNGSNSARSYNVPTGANCVTIQAWGTTGYVQASYAVNPGSNIQVTLSKSGSASTTVATSAGTITISGSSATAGGTSYNVTTMGSGGPTSPGAGNSYAGYVSITACNTLYTLSITASPSSAGIFSGQGSYAPQTTVTIQESAFAGYTSSGWGGTDSGHVTAPSSASTSIVMTDDRTLVADFSPNVPAFTSGNSSQTLIVGHPYSYQVSATQAPVFSAAGLPPGLTISSTGLISGTPTAAGSYGATITASNNAVSVEEVGVGAGEIITISSSTLGNNIQVYDTTLNLIVNGVATSGFCIDPWHSSVEGQTMTYNWETLANGPKVADGMGTAVATQIGQLWDEYYSPSMSNTTAAGLQLAIWDLVSAAISTQTGGVFNFTLDSSNNYGSTAMLAWVNANPLAASASLGAVTGSGQDYVASEAVLPQSTIASATQALPFNVYVPPAVASNTYTIPVNQPYTYSISATNSPTSYSASGLPSGFSINSTTGAIVGTPTAAGTYGVSISATNPGGTGSGTLTLTIQPTYTLTINGAPLAGGTTAGAGTYVAGTVVNISEVAGTGYRTSGWSGTDAGSVASKTSPSTTIVMSANRSLTANFVQQVTLTVNSATGGTSTNGGTFDIGTSVPITETASTGYRTNGWSGPDVGSVVSQTSATTSIQMNANKTITPSFIQQVTLTVTAGAGGTATGAGTYDIGSTVPIKETANAGFRTNGWTGTGVGNVASPSSATTNIVMASNETVAASFVQQVTLTVIAGTGGTAGGGGTYDIGSSVQLGETANSGYRANGWTGPGAANVTSPSSAFTTILMSGNETVDASFVQQGILSVNCGPGGTATGAGTYDIGSVVNILATPSTGCAFNGWTGPNINNDSAQAATVTIQGNESVSATFVATYTLTINGASSAGGAATGAGTYPSGTVVTISETPSTGYRAGGWSGQDVGSVAAPGSASTTITMTGSKTINAGFVQQATLTVVAGTGGTATGSGTYDVGTLVPITETASTGFRANGWTGPNGGSVTSPSSPSTTITLTSNATVDASFIQQATLTIVNATGGTVTGAGTYDVGSVVPIAETANGGYRATGWTGRDVGSVASPSSASTTLTLNANATVDAGFIQQVTLTVIAGAGGTAGGGGTFDIGSLAQIGETANSGYRTNGWAGPGAANVSAPSSALTTILMSANETVDASFVQQGILTVNCGPGGTATGSGTYDVGSVVNILATPSSGCAFSAWTGSNINNDSAAAATVTIQGNESVSAAFVATYTLTIVPSTGGSATGAGTYPAGTVVNISETPSAGYRVAGWSGPDVASVAAPASASSTVTINANMTIDAGFVQQATLTVLAGTGGTATGGGTYDVGTVVPIAETAANGYRTNGWTGPNGASVASQFSPATTITLNSNSTVDASFVQQATLTIVNGAGGTSTGAGTYDVGTIVPIVESANNGYRATGWTGPDVGSVATPINPSSTITLNANATVDAAFIQQVTLTVNADAGGTATGSGVYDIGSVVPIVATPNSGFAFSDWTGGAPASANAGSTTVTLGADSSVTAVFAALPPNVALNAATTAYTGSPFHVTSAATAPADNLTLHSVEWLSPSNVWTVSSNQAQGGTDNMAVGISFTSTGVWTLRAGVSVDNGTSWIYSPSTQVTVSSGFANYTLQTMAVPSGNVLLWYSPSPVAQKTYVIQHVNP